jgi:hypothetical protein
VKIPEKAGVAKPAAKVSKKKKKPKKKRYTSYVDYVLCFRKYIHFSGVLQIINRKFL